MPSGVDSRAYAELGAKGVIEIREVPEPGAECDLQNLVKRRLQAQGSLPQTRAQNELMRRYAGYVLKHPQEMELAHPGCQSQLRQRQRLAQVGLNETQG